MEEKDQAPKPVKLSQLMKNRRRRKPVDYGAKMDALLKHRGISYSGAKCFMDSPLHFYNYYYGTPKPQNDAFDKGNLFEMMLLEKHKVDRKVMIYPELNLRKPAHREIKAQIDADNPKKLIVKKDMMNEVLDMYQVIINNNEIMDIVNQAQGIQEWLDYKDPVTNFNCVGKIDFRTGLYDDYPAIYDLKTTGGSCDSDEFMRSVLKFKYHLQLGAYVWGYQKKYFVYPDYYWMVVETKEPYASNLVKADRTVMDEGVRLWTETLKLIKFAKEQNLWHLGHGFWRLRQPYDIGYLPRWYKSNI